VIRWDDRYARIRVHSANGSLVLLLLFSPPPSSLCVHVMMSYLLSLFMHNLTFSDVHSALVINECPFRLLPINDGNDIIEFGGLNGEGRGGSLDKSTFGEMNGVIGAIDDCLEGYKGEMVRLMRVVYLY